MVLQPLVIVRLLIGLTFSWLLFLVSVEGLLTNNNRCSGSPAHTRCKSPPSCFGSVSSRGRFLALVAAAAASSSSSSSSSSTPQDEFRNSQQQQQQQHQQQQLPQHSYTERIQQQQKQLESEWEQQSQMGAQKIALMDTHERAKRALLAEAMENRIGSLQQELLDLVTTAQSAASSHSRERSKKIAAATSSSSTFNAAKTVAQQIQLAQGQYKELVNGDPSDLLRALESLDSQQSTTPTNDDNEENNFGSNDLL